MYKSLMITKKIERRKHVKEINSQNPLEKASINSATVTQSTYSVM